MSDLTWAANAAYETEEMTLLEQFHAGRISAGEYAAEVADAKRERDKYADLEDY